MSATRDAMQGAGLEEVLVTTPANVTGHGPVAASSTPQTFPAAVAQALRRYGFAVEVDPAQDTPPPTQAAPRGRKGRDT